MCAKIPGSLSGIFIIIKQNQGKEVILKAENNKRLKEKKNWILLLLKKVAKLLFNRIFYVAVAILVQFGWIMMMVMRLATYSRYVDILLKLAGVVIVLWILNKEINPSYKLAWIILILVLPILGVVLYFLFGRSRIATIMQQHFEQRIEESRDYLQVVSLRSYADIVGKANQQNRKSVILFLVSIALASILMIMGITL